METMKRCTKYGEEKPATTEYFHRQSRYKDALKPWCKKCVNVYSRNHYQTWTEEKRKRHRRNHRQWIQNNRGRANDLVYKWAKENREQYYANRRNRQAKKRKINGFHSIHDLQILYEGQDGQCLWCGVELNGKYQVDHIEPLSRGGSNWPENLALTCAPCNQSKSDRLPQEWRKWQLGRID